MASVGIGLVTKNRIVEAQLAFDSVTDFDSAYLGYPRERPRTKIAIFDDYSETPEKQAWLRDITCSVFVNQFPRSEEHTSELQSHSFISYAVFCLKKKK